jgi:hypothetical protein
MKNYLNTDGCTRKLEGLSTRSMATSDKNTKKVGHQHRHLFGLNQDSPNLLAMG